MYWETEEEANREMASLAHYVEEEYSQLARLEASTELLPMKDTKIRKQREDWKEAIDDYEYYWQQYEEEGFEGHKYQGTAKFNHFGNPFEYIEEGKKMKITRRQLRRIIKEALLREGVDTDVYEGDHDPITVEIPALESLATKENFDGEKVWHGETDALVIASALEEKEPRIEDYDYDDVEHEEALADWNKVHAALEGWEPEDKEELASNIRSAIKGADDSGYEY